MEYIVDKVMSEMIHYFGRDVKRINHAIKVYGFSKNIGKIENLTDGKLQVLELAAILHDIGIKESERKYNSCAGPYQEQEGPPIATGILRKYGLEDSVIERVCYLIGHHHTYHKIDDVDFQILVEADFIVNIYEDNMNHEQIRSIKEKYFKTNAGRMYISEMYL